MLQSYFEHRSDRLRQGLPAKPLNFKWIQELVELLQQPNLENPEQFCDLLQHNVPPGVDEAAYVKALFLKGVILGEQQSPYITPTLAIKMLGGMHGGYSVAILVELLQSDKYADLAAQQLQYNILIFDTFFDIAKLADVGNTAAKGLIQSWADGEWFTSRPQLTKTFKTTVFKVSGETNTDDLSPAPDAWSRPDIPLHAQAMYKMAREGITPDKVGEIGPMQAIESLRNKGLPITLVGDVVGTGSSRKSGVNSVLWHFGEDIAGVPNKRGGGICIGAKIAPIFFNTLEDAGTLPIECDVDAIDHGATIVIKPYEGLIESEDGSVVAEFTLRSQVLLDSTRAGGRINLIIGRGLTARAREYLQLPASDLFRKPEQGKQPAGYTLAQKMVARACGTDGVSPGDYCEPVMTTVGSQDTTGPMTRDELKDLACLGFSADLVMQSFCHTAAYPKPIDIETQHNLPDFIRNRGGISLRPGDGIIHSWLNRMLLPDTVGTGADSHTRFPIGISFPAGSGLVAFAAATGIMPLDMPESVLVRFKGTMQAGITLRDLVHAIPYFAIQQGLLTVEKKNKKNIFSGRILEIEGLEHLTCEQAFELSDASAERSAAGCTIRLSEQSIAEYLRSNIVMLRWMISEGYGDIKTLERRAQKMEQWLAKPQLLEADGNAEYAAVIDIDLATIDQPIVCAPNDPDDARLLSEVEGDSIDEVFIGSCMTNIGHFRAAGKMLERSGGTVKSKLWIVPPTRMDEHALMQEGYYSIYGKSGARTEMPGCSLCMGNQARVADGATVLSTSTRNFPNRLGNGANVYLTSAELAAVGALIGRIPTVSEYKEFADQIDSQAAEIYRYMNFDQIASYRKAAKDGAAIAVKQIVVSK